MSEGAEEGVTRLKLSRRALGSGLVAAALVPGAALEARPLKKAEGDLVRPVARRGCTVTPLPTGLVLVAGGIQTSPTGLAQIYDPEQDAWFAAAPMNTPRAYHAAAPLPDGRVLVAGGRYIHTLSSAEIYDPRRDQWISVAPMNTPRSEHGAAALNRGNVLVTGGFHRGPLSSAELYEAVADRWTLL